MSTGPGRPERAIRNASRNTHAAWAGSVSCTAHFVTGLAISTMSTAWNASWCSSARSACTVMQMIGMESASAVQRPVIMFVPAGPEVPIVTPTLPVARAHPSAACVPPASWRTVRCLIPLSRSAAYSGRIAAPGMPKTVSTPSDPMTAATASMQGTTLLAVVAIA